VLSSMASNYDAARLAQGGAIAALSVILALLACFGSFSGPASAVTPYAAITALYGIMMFASSYVEEEQHYWYWSTTAWLALLARSK
jgi:ethanolamine phosphate transferase 2 subunit G